MRRAIRLSQRRNAHGRAAIASGAPIVAQAASSDPEFGAKSVYNLAIRATNPPGQTLPYLRPLPRHPARRPHQCFKPRHVRPRRRRLQRMGRLRPHHVQRTPHPLLVYAATAPDELLTTTNDSSGKETGASAHTPKPQRPQNHHHPSRPRQRRRPLRRRPRRRPALTFVILRRVLCAEGSLHLFRTSLNPVNYLRQLPSQQFHASLYLPIFRPLELRYNPTLHFPRTFFSGK